jgi:phage repressor protein C with HTH and peptisase S24 domain
MHIHDKKESTMNNTALGQRIAFTCDHLGSRTHAADVMGISRGQLFRYIKGESQPTADPLAQLALATGVNAHWLITGQGIPTPDHTPTLPLIGLAKCGLRDWFAPAAQTRLNTPCPSDMTDPEGFAVMAVGTSMQPAGIREGFLCLCAPNTAYTAEDIVYVEDTTGIASLKLLKKEDADYVWLQGWLPPDELDRQKPYIEQRRKNIIKRIAPVIYIKRKV